MAGAAEGTGAAGPRLLFVTGPGGDGTTTIAAATAAAAARAGRATLLLSGAPPGQLARVLGAAPPAWPDEPVATPAGFRAVRADSGRWFADGLLALQRHAAPALDAVGGRPFDGEELTELPGAPACALLQAVHQARARGGHDLLVVDLGETTEAIRLLALPGQLRRYLSRLLPRERLVARALRPLLTQLAGVPMPAAGLFAAADRWHRALTAAEDLSGAAVRLVLDPAGRSAEALRLARAGLGLHGVPLESVVANRMLPATPAGGGPLAALAARQREALERLAAVPGLARPREVAHLGHEPGPGDLAALAVPPPSAAAVRDEPELTDRLGTDGLLYWRLPVPGARREDLDLVRRGDELLVTAGPFRRALPLPAVLRRCTVTGAALEDDGRLAVRFAPDPGLWPRTAPGG